jgi:hypothetical protein
VWTHEGAFCSMLPSVAAIVCFEIGCVDGEPLMRGVEARKVGDAEVASRVAR